METNNMEMYEAPKVEIIEVEVEKGFAVVVEQKTMTNILGN